MKKQDGHVHEVVLPDGGVVTTGPEIMPGAGLAEPTARQSDVPPPVKSEKQEGGPVDELEKAAAAIRARSVDDLPEYGREVFDRMRASTYAMFGKADDPASIDYAAAVAWRAVGQAYGLDRGPDPVAAPAPKAAPVWPKPAAKYAPGGPVYSSGAFWVVQWTRSRGAEKFYDRIEDRPIPDSGGAVVRVGIGRQHNIKNIIDIRVPKRVVDSTPGGAGPRAWVYQNWDFIRAIAKAEVSPGGLFRTSVVKSIQNQPILQVKSARFVTDPKQATERITYDVVYAPWEVDLQGQYATEEQVRKMAHDYQGETNLMHIDGLVMSDGQPAGRPVESFIARGGDPDFPRGSWVMGVKWHPEAWKEIVAGNITGYSIEGMWGVQPLHRVARRAQ